MSDKLNVHGIPLGLGMVMKINFFELFFEFSWYRINRARFKTIREE